MFYPYHYSGQPYPMYPTGPFGFVSQPVYPYPTPASGWDRQPQQHSPFPAVDTTIFSQSVGAFQALIRQADIVLDKISGSREFAIQLMNAAQMGNQAEVNRLIKSTGVSSNITASYTPDGILFRLHADVQGSPCCSLAMYLRWG